MQDGTPIIIKKKKKHAHGHHGGAWKVAYADFVTAMMAFFLVMWILGMNDEQKESIAAYFNDPVGYSKAQPKYPIAIGLDGKPASRRTAEKSGGENQVTMSQENAEMRRIKGQVEEKLEEDPELKRLAQTGGISVNQTSEGLVIEIIENETKGEVFFTLGSAEVRPQARAMFARIAPVLAASKRLLFIDGHTDSLPLNRAGYDNFDLSGERANAVRRLLKAGGVPVNQFLGVRAKGATEPRLPNDPTHFSNRRVTILMPYRYNPGPVDSLPVDINSKEVEGAFAGAPRAEIDLRTEYERQRAEAAKAAERPNRPMPYLEN